MAEEHISEDDNDEQQTIFSGQLGGLSTTWLNLLTKSEEPLPPTALPAPDQSLPFPGSSAGFGPADGSFTHPANVYRFPDDNNTEQADEQMPRWPESEQSRSQHGKRTGEKGEDHFPSWRKRPDTGDTQNPPSTSPPLSSLSSLFEARYGQPSTPPESQSSSPSRPKNDPGSPIPSDAHTSQAQHYTNEILSSKAADAPVNSEIGRTNVAPISSKVSKPMRARRPNEDYYNADLQQRRAEDEQRTGRRWPGNSIPYPSSPHEAMFFDQLAIALGEVDPQLLARESSVRYVRSSRIPGEDDLGPTDIYAILYYGLGLTLRPLDCTGLPHILAMYNRFLHEIYIDWTLLPDAPYGPTTLDPTTWRRAIDASQSARLLLAWCAATHIVDNYDVPLVLGFQAQFAPIAPAMGPSAASTRGATPPPLGSDAFNRYRKTVIALAALLAPQDRLWQQITAMRLRIRMGDPDWRAHMRAEYRYTGNWSRPDLSEQRLPGGFNHPNNTDPVEQLIAVLASQNNCPPLLIEAQLDDTTGAPDWNWDRWSMQLLRDIPNLQMRYAAAERYFSSGASAMGNVRPSLGRMPDLLPMYVRVCF